MKLAAPLGMYPDYLGWSQVFYGGLLGFVVGGVMTVLLVLLKRGIKPAEVAHGPAFSQRQPQWRSSLPDLRTIFAGFTSGTRHHCLGA